MAEPRIRYAKTQDGVNIAFTVVGEGPTLVVPPSVFSDRGEFVAKGFEEPVPVCKVKWLE